MVKKFLRRIILGYKIDVSSTLMAQDRFYYKHGKKSSIFLFHYRQLWFKEYRDPIYGAGADTFDNEHHFSFSNRWFWSIIRSKKSGVVTTEFQS